MANNINPLSSVSKRHMLDEPSFGEDLINNISDSITTTSDGGSSVYAPDSMDDDSVIATSSNKEVTHNTGNRKDETLLIFDYDDTLLPTTFLAQHGYRLDGPDASKEIQAILDAYSGVVERTLIEAERHGQVVILTNAESGWITLTAQKFMPRLGDLLERYPMVSARSTYEPLGITSPFQWKVRAFESVIQEHYEALPGFKTRNVLSFGDSTHERDAAHQVCARLSDTVCKSVKFMERPDISQLTRQHNLIKDCFEQVVYHDGTLDLCIQCQQPGSIDTPSDDIM